VLVDAKQDLRPQTRGYPGPPFVLEPVGRGTQPEVALPWWHPPFVVLEPWAEQTQRRRGGERDREPGACTYQRFPSHREDPQARVLCFPGAVCTAGRQSEDTCK